jgi:hypothetical protein
MKLKRCGAEKKTSCPCRRLHIGGQQEGRDPLADIPVSQPWTPHTDAAILHSGDEGAV